MVPESAGSYKMRLCGLEKSDGLHLHLDTDSFVSLVELVPGVMP